LDYLVRNRHNYETIKNVRTFALYYNILILLNTYCEVFIIQRLELFKAFRLRTW